MASIPFAGRYRMVDFVLSSMANCGISTCLSWCAGYTTPDGSSGYRPRSGTMARRHGSLNIVLLRWEKGVRIYSGRVGSYSSI